MHEQGGEWKFFIGHFHHIKAFSLCSSSNILGLLGFLYSTRKMRQPHPGEKYHVIQVYKSW